MSIDDTAVSELLGYTVLVAIVSIAAIGLMSTSASMILTSERSLELSGVNGAMEAIAREAFIVAETNNTYYTVQELYVPGGYDLMIRDSEDDYRSVRLFVDGNLVASIRLGSVCLHSQFRSSTFEGGAVISNDSGNIVSVLSPRIQAVRSPSGKDSIYATLIAVSCDTITHGEGPVTPGIKCESIKTLKWHISDTSEVAIRVASENAAGWERAFTTAGLDVSYEDGTIKATSRRISDVYVTIATVNFEQV